MLTPLLLTVELARERQAELRREACRYRPPRRPLEVGHAFTSFVGRLRPHPEPAHDLACVTC